MLETNQFVGSKDPLGMLTGSHIKFTLSVPAKIARYWLKYKNENPRGLSNVIVRETLPFFQELYGDDISSDFCGDDSEMKKSFSKQILETVMPAIYENQLDLENPLKPENKYFNFEYFARLLSRAPLYVLEMYVIRRYWNNLIALGYFVQHPENPGLVRLSDELFKAEGRLEGLQ